MGKQGKYTQCTKTVMLSGQNNTEKPLSFKYRKRGDNVTFCCSIKHSIDANVLDIL